MSSFSGSVPFNQKDADGILTTFDLENRQEIAANVHHGPRVRCGVAGIIACTVSEYLAIPRALSKAKRPEMAASAESPAKYRSFLVVDPQDGGPFRKNNRVFPVVRALKVGGTHLVTLGAIEPLGLVLSKILCNHH